MQSPCSHLIAVHASSEHGYCIQTAQEVKWVDHCCETREIHPKSAENLPERFHACRLWSTAISCLSPQAS
jgi:hypothetical protein